METLDVVIVGAGLSGIGAACHLEDRCPGRTYTLLESRDALGGTWDLFRYPGIRSDSDMHTLGYQFKPWKARKSIADGPSIRAYVEEAATDYGVQQHIRYRHQLRKAAWSSAQNLWILEIERPEEGDTLQLGCRFLLMCSGYYDYERGYRPEFEGLDDYEGRVVDPQFWPEDLDYEGKRVAVIGSGATAMTIVPNMADQAAHVTMVQRSPTYVVSRPEEDRLANTLRKILPEKWAYALTRFKNVQLQRFVYARTRSQPREVRDRLLGMVRAELGADYDIDTHFTPRYDPWDQRLCLIPDGDLFEGIREGRVSVVTEQLARFTKSGLQMESGREIDADVVVTATGLELKLLGGVEFELDGAPIDFAKTWTYKGMMYSDVPNLVQTFGYINASWTLRADLTSEYVCRLLEQMESLGAEVCVPRLRSEDQGMPERPWIENFTSGYMQRSMHLMPRQGDHDPWRNTQNYAADKKMIRKAPLEDGVLQFER
jgi:cation diffusion facilitator CzcD-associated flavoprotein CzcO